jgi:hypothetical protein
VFGKPRKVYASFSKFFEAKIQVCVRYDKCRLYLGLGRGARFEGKFSIHLFRFFDTIKLGRALHTGTKWTGTVKSFH